MRASPSTRMCLMSAHFFISIKFMDCQTRIELFVDTLFYVCFTESRYGDTFDQTLHPQGTEIKAITYSNMQIHETLERTDLYVIVDI